MIWTLCQRLRGLRLVAFGVAGTSEQAMLAARLVIVGEAPSARRVAVRVRDKHWEVWASR